MRARASQRSAARPKMYFRRSDAHAPGRQTFRCSNDEFRTQPGYKNIGSEILGAKKKKNKTNRKEKGTTIGSDARGTGENANER